MFLDQTLNEQAPRLAKFFSEHLRIALTESQAREALCRALADKTYHELVHHTVLLGAAKGVSPLPILDVSMPDLVGDYDQPENVTEWQWIEANASFHHKDNGASPGVWEHMVHIRHAQAEDMPERLRPVFGRAQLMGAGWVLFHQG